MKNKTFSPTGDARGFIKRKQTMVKRSCTKSQKGHFNQSINRQQKSFLPSDKVNDDKKRPVSWAAQISSNLEESLDSKSGDIGRNVLRAFKDDQQRSR